MKQVSLCAGISLMLASGCSNRKRRIHEQTEKVFRRRYLVAERAIGTKRPGYPGIWRRRHDRY